MAQASIKINRLKAIKSLEDNLKQIKEHAKVVSKYNSEYETWLKSADLSSSNIKSSLITTNGANEPQCVVVELKKYPPNKPKAPDTHRLLVNGYWRLRPEEVIREMENLISLLNLSDEETVSAVMSRTITQYL